jgi:cell division protease FtsH
VAVPLPDQAGREAVLRTHLRGVVTGGDVDAALLARATGGMSGAELAGLVNQAALAAAKEVSPSLELVKYELVKLLSDDRRRGGLAPPSNLVKYELAKQH